MTNYIEGMALFYQLSQFCQLFSTLRKYRRLELQRRRYDGPSPSRSMMGLVEERDSEDQQVAIE
jgi:hypothetical protein